MHLSSINETDISPTSTNIILFNPMASNNFKNFGFSDYVPSPTNTTLSNLNFDNPFIPQKPRKDFHPFIHERDGLNRLLTVPSKYDPDSLPEPSNPSLYYKAERFNKERLVLLQADGNKHALAKLLKYNTRRNEGLNFMELALLARKKRLPTPKDVSSPMIKKKEKWPELDALSEEKEADEVEVKSKASPKKVILEPIETTKEEDIPKDMIKTSNMSPCLAKYMKKDQKNFRRRMYSKAEGRDQASVERTKSKAGMKARNLSVSIFAPKKLSKVFDTSDDFCGFYNKLDGDSRKISFSTQEDFKRRTQGNFSGLNTVCKKFTEIVTQTRPERGGMSSPLLSPLFSPKATTSLSTQQSEKMMRRLKIGKDLHMVNSFVTAAGRPSSNLESVRVEPLKLNFRKEPYLNQFVKKKAQNW